MMTNATAADWTPYVITFRKGRRTMTWMRLAPNAQHAAESAAKALRDEYYGAATLLSVVAATEAQSRAMYEGRSISALSPVAEALAARFEARLRA
jgi:hypothetical protein